MLTLSLGVRYDYQDQVQLSKKAYSPRLGVAFAPNERTLFRAGAGKFYQYQSTAIPANITRDNWLRQMNNVDCIGCHQIGQESTRTIPAGFGSFTSGREAWVRRIQSGQAGEQMTNSLREFRNVLSIES